MQFRYRELEDGIKLIGLDGMLDMTGVTRVERKLAEHVAGQDARVILDLSEVTFLASIGIRLIVNTAKSVASRGGRLVLLNPIQGVEEILEVTGVAEVIPVCAKLEEARLVFTS